jgi:hypothetical protein
LFKVITKESAAKVKAEKKKKKSKDEVSVSDNRSINERHVTCMGDTYANNKVAWRKSLDGMYHVLVLVE